MKLVARVAFASILALSMAGAGRFAVAQTDNTDREPPPYPVPGSPAGYAPGPAPYSSQNAAPYYSQERPPYYSQGSAPPRNPADSQPPSYYQGSGYSQGPSPYTLGAAADYGPDTGPVDPNAPGPERMDAEGPTPIPPAPSAPISSAPISSAASSSAPTPTLTSSMPTPHMPREVIEAASAYETFIERAAAIDARFANGDAVGAAMTTAESYQANQLAEGAVAYAALIALQDARFVEGVRAIGRDPNAGDALVRTVEIDPAKVAGLPGADEAATRINATLADQAEQVRKTGQKVRQAAYDMQRDDWTRREPPDGPALLARAKALSSSSINPSADDIARLFQVATALRDQTLSGSGPAPGYTAVVQRGLALAVLALLGRANRDEIEATGLVRVRDSADCMQAAKLNLYQCLAVAGPHYEDVFCIGEHALKETGQCLLQGAGAPAIPPMSMASSNATSAVAADSYAVPVAYSATERH